MSAERLARNLVAISKTSVQLVVLFIPLNDGFIRGGVSLPSVLSKTIKVEIMDTSARLF
jgi:hypothetical protein